jgi:hypothetical protein
MLVGKCHCKKLGDISTPFQFLFQKMIIGSLVILSTPIGYTMLTALALKQWYWPLDKFNEEYNVVGINLLRWPLRKEEPLGPGPLDIEKCARQVPMGHLDLHRQATPKFTAIFSTFIPRNPSENLSQFLSFVTRKSNHYIVFSLNVEITQNNKAYFKVQQHHNKETRITIDLDASIGTWHQFVISIQIDEFRCQVDDSKEKWLRGPKVQLHLQRGRKMVYFIIKSRYKYKDKEWMTKLFLFDDVLTAQEIAFAKSWVKGLFYNCLKGRMVASETGHCRNKHMVNLRQTTRTPVM